MADSKAIIRTRIADRAEWKCEYCKSPQKYWPTFELDHVLPSSKGGSGSIDNLAFSCRDCNLRKSGFVDHHDRVTGRKFRLFNPRIDRWSKHFAWDFGYRNIVGLTGIGRATVERLLLNRESVQNYRELLHKNSEHP